MKNKLSNIVKSLIGGGGVIAGIFLIGYVGIGGTERAEAQTVRHCPSSGLSFSLPEGRNPHTLGNCTTAGFPVRYTNFNHNCGRCLDTSCRSSSDSLNTELANEGGMIYTLNGQTFCGPRMQCDAVGGMLADGTMCDCSLPGHQRNAAGVCALVCPQGERSLEIDGAFRCVPEACEGGQVRDSLGECVAPSNLLCPAREVEVRDNNGVTVTLSLSRDAHLSESCGGGARISDLADANCGTCQPRDNCGGSNVNYRTADGNDYCGPVSQCNAASGNRIVFGRGSANMTCDGECTDSSHLRFGNGTPELRDDLCATPITCAAGEIPNDTNTGCIALPHQTCFDANFRMPIAVRAFTGTSPGEGDCRPAADTEADRAICAIIDPPSVSADPGRYMEVLEGACAVNSSCAAGSFLSLPELHDPSITRTVLHFVGSCDTEAQCEAGDGVGAAGFALSPGFADRDENECRLATNNEECASIGDGSTPEYDREEPTRCRATDVDDCDPNEIFENGTCEACDATTHHRPNAAQTACIPCLADEVVTSGGDSCEPCQTDHRRAVEESSCTCRDDYYTGGGSCVPFINPADDCELNQILNRDQNACQDCGENEVRGAGGACECQYSGTVGSCAPETTLSECGPHEFLENNVCTECDPNEIRGMDGSCEPCQANHVRVMDADSCTCRQDYFTGGGSCVPFINPATECEDTQILNRADNSCQDCGENEVRGADGMCDCQQFGEVGNCVPIREVSTCAANEHIVDNECAECPVDQYRGDGNSSCTACPTNEVRAAEAASCSCPRQTHYKAGEGALCVPHAMCAEGEVRNAADNTCTSGCPANEDLRDGACRCRGSQIRVNGAGACVDPVSCIGGVVTAANTCQCPDTHEDISGTCTQSCHENAQRQDGTCRCNADYEGDGFSCAACENGQTSEAGRSCACPNNQRLFTDGCAIPRECGAQVLGLDNVCTDECTGGLLNIGGVCEEMMNCSDPYEHDAPTNRCICPSGQRENADQTGCEAIPAASSGGGGGGGGGGAAAAIIAVPVVLIGGYWLLGGFGYVDPVYDFSYSGENENFHYTGNAGFNLRHGGLRSYASAIQTNGDAVSYKSGISYERDFLSLAYDAAESDSEYLYDFGARMNAEVGLWTISPTAAAEIQYQTSEEAWDSDASAGLEAAWTAHRWLVRARSAFAGGGGVHEVDLEVKF